MSFRAKRPREIDLYQRSLDMIASAPVVTTPFNYPASEPKNPPYLSRISPSVTAARERLVKLNQEHAGHADHFSSGVDALGDTYCLQDKVVVKCIHKDSRHKGLEGVRV